MPRVRIEPGTDALALRAGERLLDALDDARVGAIAFSCRDASCGTCRIVVVAGGDALVAPAAAERATLSALRASRAERLACQLTVSDAAGEIVLRVVRPRS